MQLCEFTKPIGAAFAGIMAGSIVTVVHASLAADWFESSADSDKTNSGKHACKAKNKKKAIKGYSDCKGSRAIEIKGYNDCKGSRAVKINDSDKTQAPGSGNGSGSDLHRAVNAKAGSRTLIN